MVQVVFISGIGTGIGKSFVSRLLAQGLMADYWKPVQTGSDKDTDEMQRHLKGKIWECVYDFPEPIAPYAAAEKHHRVIELERIVEKYHNIKAHSKAPYIVIEGAGGIYAPISLQHTNKDIATALQCPLLMVSDHYLGALNHTLLADAAMKDIRINKKAWIFNRYDQAPADYEHFLRQQLLHPCIATFPTYDGKNTNIPPNYIDIEHIRDYLSS